MRHIGKLTKVPAPALDLSHPLYLGPAFWSAIIPGGPFQERGDLVTKWNAKANDVLDQV